MNGNDAYELEEQFYAKLGRLPENAFELIEEMYPDVCGFVEIEGKWFPADTPEE